MRYKIIQISLSVLLAFVCFLLVGAPYLKTQQIVKIKEVGYKTEGIYKINISKKLKKRSIKILDPYTLESLVKQRKVARLIAEKGVFSDIDEFDSHKIIPLQSNKNGILAFMINKEGEVYKVNEDNNIDSNRTVLFNSDYFDYPKKFNQDHVLPVKIKIKKRGKRNQLVIKRKHEHRPEVLVKINKKIAYLVKLQSESDSEAKKEHSTVIYLPIVNVEEIADAREDNPPSSSDDNNNKTETVAEDQKNNQNNSGSSQSPQGGDDDSTQIDDPLMGCVENPYCHSGDPCPEDQVLEDGVCVDRKCLICDWQANSHNPGESEQFQSTCEDLVEDQNEYHKAKAFPRYLDYERIGDHWTNHSWCPKEDSKLKAERDNFKKNCGSITYAYEGHGYDDTLLTCVKEIAEVCTENNGVPPKHFLCLTFACKAASNEEDLVDYLEDVQSKYPWIEWEAIGSPVLTWSDSDGKLASYFAQPINKFKVQATGVKVTREACSAMIGEDIAVLNNAPIDSFECFDDLSCEFRFDLDGIPTKTLYACPEPRPKPNSKVEDIAVMGKWTETECEPLLTESVFGLEFYK